jgi:hypothetical protein
MSWSNKSLQQARIWSMKLADVCIKAFGMPLNDPAYRGALASIADSIGNSGG